MFYEDLKGKKVLVTGASSGIKTVQKKPSNKSKKIVMGFYCEWMSETRSRFKKWSNSSPKLPEA
jgi:hypothetical protein